jgi:hypothetical protein
MGCFIEVPEGYVNKALETGIYPHRGPVWEPEGGQLSHGLLEKGETFLLEELVLGNPRDT